MPHQPPAASTIDLAPTNVLPTGALELRPLAPIPRTEPPHSGGSAPQAPVAFPAVARPPLPPPPGAPPTGAPPLPQAEGKPAAVALAARAAEPPTAALPPPPPAQMASDASAAGAPVAGTLELPPSAGTAGDALKGGAEAVGDAGAASRVEGQQLPAPQGAAMGAEEQPLPAPPTSDAEGGGAGGGGEASVPPALGAPPPLAEVLAAALPEGAVGDLQQQADASMMLLRVEWKKEGVLDSVQARCHATLHFIGRLGTIASEIGTLKGTIFQAVMARHNAELQRKRDEEERRLALQEAMQVDEEGVAGGAVGAAAEGVEAARGALRSGGTELPPLPPCLQALDLALIDALAAAAAELRALLRIKVEDDQDLLTAQRALAECGYFLLLLRAEAPKRGLTEAALLKKCELGEG